MGKLEKHFEREVIKEITSWDKDVLVSKNDPHDSFQGYPDRLVIYHDKYAMLEFKKNKNSKHQPNQDFYIDHFKQHAFGEFIYPENKKEVLQNLKEYLFKEDSNE